MFRYYDLVPWFSLQYLKKISHTQTLQGLHYGKTNQKGRKKLCYFLKNFMGWVSCFYFSNNSFFITGNASLTLKIFNNKTHIILFLTRKLLFLSYVLLFTVLLLIFLNCICHLNFLSLIYFFHYVNHE